MDEMEKFLEDTNYQGSFKKTRVPDSPVSVKNR